MRTWIVKFALPVLALIMAELMLKPLSKMLNMSPVVSVLYILAVSIVLAAVYNIISKKKSAQLLLDGRGGRGGGGRAEGKNSMVVGGKGGKGGSPDSGRGGDGGGGNATGDGAIVIGGDGGDAGRFDGRGGKGGDSPLKTLSPDVLKSFGLTGNEGYGQGGSGTNSREYDRGLKVLCALSSEYLSNNPAAPMIPMPGVLMPPES